MKLYRVEPRGNTDKTRFYAVMSKGKVVNTYKSEYMAKDMAAKLNEEHIRKSVGEAKPSIRIINGGYVIMKGSTLLGSYPTMRVAREEIERLAKSA